MVTRPDQQVGMDDIFDETVDEVTPVGQYPKTISSQFFPEQPNILPLDAASYLLPFLRDPNDPKYRTPSLTDEQINKMYAPTDFSGQKKLSLAQFGFGLMRPTEGGRIGAVLADSGARLAGDLSKTSGSFKIDHPLKPDTHHLVHSFVEGPQADNLYRGVIELNNGKATIDLDEWFGMTPGTFLALNRDIQAFVNNADTWDLVRAKVMGSQLIIDCQNPDSNAEVSWLVIGERQDKEIHNSVLTDDNGKVIIEPLKTTENNV